MAKLTAVSLVRHLTSVSNPSVTDIVDLFGGLLVRTSVKNFVRVFHSDFEDYPMKSGAGPSRFGYFADIKHKKNETFAPNITRLLRNTQTESQFPNNFEFFMIFGAKLPHFTSQSVNIQGK